jgi:hypothetical protein
MGVYMDARIGVRIGVRMGVRVGVRRAVRVDDYRAFLVYRLLAPRVTNLIFAM